MMIKLSDRIQFGYLASLLVLGIGPVNTYDEYIHYGEIELGSLNTSEGITFRYAQAIFGPQLPTKQYFKGVLHKAVPKDGCGVIAPPPAVSHLPYGLQWIALIERSDKSVKACNFLDKVLNAQKSGYGGVIVYNYDTGEDGLLRMNTDNHTGARLVQIPSAFVQNEDGLEMCARSYPDTQYFMTTAEFKPIPDAGDINPYRVLIPMAFSFFGILLIAIVVMIVRWCQALRRRQRSRISKRQLKKLPLVKYKKDDQYDCCAICLDDYEEGEKVRLLPCAHTYHQKCIDPWLLKNKRTCPVCKRRVIPRKHRRARQPGDSSDSDEGERREMNNERTPLLPPPAGGATATSTGRLGAVGGAAQYGTSGRPERRVDSVTVAVSIENDEQLGHGQRSATDRNGRSTAHRGRQNPGSRRRRTAESSSSDEISDVENDLRRSILVQVSMIPQSYVDVGHRLSSFPSRSGFSQSTDDFHSSVPPIGETEQRAAERSTHDRSHDDDQLATRSYDQDHLEAQSDDHNTVATDDQTLLIANNIIV